MISALQVFVIAFCIVFFLYVLHLVAQDKLLLKYSLLWLLLTVLLLFFSVCPGLVYHFSKFFGFETASNFIFFVGLFCLLAISLSLSVILSQQTLKIKNLTQAIALLKKDIEENAERNAQ